MTHVNEPTDDLPPNIRFEKYATLYAQLGFPVFPVYEILHGHDGALECGCQAYKRKRAKQLYCEEAPSCDRPGKHPRVDSWTKRATTNVEQIRRWANKMASANIGVVMGGGYFALDVDGEQGKEALLDLELKNGALPKTVTTITGSRSGVHYLFRVPDGVVVKNSASTIAPKLDIRGAGGFIVGAGSNHKSGGVYQFAPNLAPNEAEIALAPEWLLDLVSGKEKKEKRKKASGTRQKSKGGKGSDKGEHVGFEDHLASIGDREGQKGFDAPINSACCSFFVKHGADADAQPLMARLKETIEAAWEDPAQPRKDRYRSDEYLVERIENAREFVRKTPKSPCDEYLFDDEDELVNKLNETFALVTIGNVTRYIRERGEEFDVLSKQACQDVLAPYALLVDTGRGVVRVDGFKLWLRSPKRREYTGLCFEPQTLVPGVYNLWKGFGVEPHPGEWKLMKRHLLEIVCKGDAKNYHWLLSWAAQSVQDPCNKPGTALALRGKKGTGKSTVCDWLTAIFGAHAVTIDKPKMLVGNFNAHLERCALLIAEEGFFAGDKEADSVIKNLITGSTFMMERKGIDAVKASNHIHLIVATNAEWAIPASFDERRFFVLDVSDAVAKDRAYFAALRAEFENGGPAAMLYDLLQYDYADVDLRNPPRTSGLVTQMLQSLPSKIAWWRSALADGDFDVADGAAAESETNGWYQGPIEVRKSLVHESFNAHVPGFRNKPWATSQIGTFLKEMVPDIETTRRSGGNRERCYRFPALAVLRARFVEDFGIEFDADMLGDGAEESPTAQANASQH